MSTRTIKGDSLILDDGPLPAKGSEVTELRNNSGIIRFWNGSAWINLITSTTSLVGSVNLDWNEPAGQSAVSVEEFQMQMYLFPTGSNVKLIAFLKVPATYSPGTQITMRVPHYSPSAANTILIKATSYLVRKNTDAVDSVANSYNSTNPALTNTVANQYREAIIDLTDGAGEINSIALAAGDVIRLELSRGVDTDISDIRVVDESTEVTY